MSGQPIRAELAVRHILGSAPLLAVPRVPSDVGVRAEPIAHYPTSDGAALFLIETDSISLIGPRTSRRCTSSKLARPCSGMRLVYHPFIKYK